jgi:hypothetical protein
VKRCAVWELWALVSPGTVNSGIWLCAVGLITQNDQVDMIISGPRGILVGDICLLFELRVTQLMRVSQEGTLEPASEPAWKQLIGAWRPPDQGCNGFGERKLSRGCCGRGWQVRGGKGTSSEGKLCRGGGVPGPVGETFFSPFPTFHLPPSLPVTHAHAHAHVHAHVHAHTHTHAHAHTHTRALLLPDLKPLRSGRGLSFSLGFLGLGGCPTESTQR